MTVLVAVGAVFLSTADVLAQEEKRPRVVTTFLPGYSLAASVAGDLAEVTNLLPSGGNLHDYQMTPRDMRQLAGADLIIINGLGLESFLDRAMANLGTELERKVVRMSDGLEGRLIEEGHDHDHGHEHHDHDHAHGEHNPHIWLDPRLAAHAVTNITRALQRVDAGRSEEYAKNAAALVERLKALDAELEARLRPLSGRAFVTYHNAFPYLVRRYGLELAGVVELSPEVAPSPREMSRLLRTIREREVKALFTEPGSRSRLAERIARDAGVKLAELDPLESGELKAEAYEEGMRRNGEALVNALQ